MLGRVFFYTHLTIGVADAATEPARFKALFEKDFAHRGFEWGSAFAEKALRRESTRRPWLARA